MKNYAVDYDKPVATAPREAGVLPVERESEAQAETSPEVTPPSDEASQEDREAGDIVAERMRIDLYSASPKDLLLYFTNRFKMQHGYEYKTDWVKDLAVMKAFIGRYGPDAGHLIRILFDDFNGTWNGSALTVSAFSRGAKWIQDELYNQLKLGQQKAQKRETRQVERGVLLDSDSFLERFKRD